ncbi:hypothetical protein HN51_062719 [Arachis hypogaea]
MKFRDLNIFLHLTTATTSTSFDDPRLPPQFSLHITNRKSLEIQRSRGEPYMEEARWGRTNIFKNMPPQEETEIGKVALGEVDRHGIYCTVFFHYSHPDVFDKLFHLTRRGVSKASKVINLSEDIFTGFNSTLREGNVTHHEYIQVGKGRDVGLNQITMFEVKIANGNGEQPQSQDIYRLGHRFDFFIMLFCYFTTVGFYFSTLICNHMI